MLVMKSVNTLIPPQYTISHLLQLLENGYHINSTLNIQDNFGQPGQ
jgi:hypothetical protein